MRKKIVLCLCLCILISDSGAESFEQNEKLDQVRSNIDAVKKKMQQIMLQQNTLNDQLAEIEYRYGESAALLRDLRNKVDRKREKLNGLRQDIQNHRAQIARHGKELSVHIRAAYAMGQQEKLKLILNQQDPVLSSRMMVYQGYFNRSRLKKMAEIEGAIKQLERLNKQQQTDARLLERDLDQKKLEQAALDKLRLERSELLEQLANDFSSHEHQLTQLEESETKLKNLIDALQDREDSLASESVQAENLPESTDESTVMTEDESNNGEFFKNDELSEANADFYLLKGKLPWPIKGKLAADAGNERLEAIRDGVLIEADEGTEIHAVTNGKVVYSEWLRGYGLLMIIDHGKGYMTLYAFNQSLYKRVGDLVQAGEVIASVGQSGGRSRSGLYFGIRKDGKPADPLEWCSKSSRDQMG